MKPLALGFFLAVACMAPAHAITSCIDTGTSIICTDTDASTIRSCIRAGTSTICN